jgi:hypothetical protein
VTSLKNNRHNLDYSCIINENSVEPQSLQSLSNHNYSFYYQNSSTPNNTIQNDINNLDLSYNDIQWNSVRTNPAYNERSDITNRIESPVCKFYIILTNLFGYNEPRLQRTLAFTSNVQYLGAKAVYSVITYKYNVRTCTFVTF